MVCGILQPCLLCLDVVPIPGCLVLVLLVLNNAWIALTSPHLVLMSIPDASIYMYDYRNTLTKWGPTSFCFNFGFSPFLLLLLTMSTRSPGLYRRGSSVPSVLMWSFCFCNSWWKVCSLAVSSCTCSCVSWLLAHVDPALCQVAWARAPTSACLLFPPLLNVSSLSMLWWVGGVLSPILPFLFSTTVLLEYPRFLFCLSTTPFIWGW